MSNGICPLVQYVIILRLVYPDAPKNYRRVVHILRDHLTGVLNRLILPSIVSDMLPAWYLGKHEQTEFIAPVYKMLRLRIVRGAHSVDTELVFEDIRIKSLH